MPDTATRKDFSDFGIEIPSGRRGEVDTTCPQCSPTRKKSRDKCLSVNTDLGVWYCNHCGFKGGLGPEGNAIRPEPTPKIEYKIPAPPPESIVPAPVLQWFEQRGIPEWVLEQAGITAGKEFCPSLGREVTAIRFPYLRDGSLVNIKYRAQPKEFWMVGGAERILYGYDDVRSAETICIVEGEMDKLSIDAVQGWPTCSVPDGAPAVNATNYANKFTFLESAQEIFANAKRVVLACDMDEPGQKLTEELARRIGYEKCEKVTWPEGCKDANETLVKRGDRALLQAIADAQPYPIAGLITVRDLGPASDHLYDVGLDKGVEVGWRHFDELLRWREGLFYILTGSPGSGKSHFVDNIFVRLAQRHGWTFGVCSPENQPLERHLAGILSIHVEKPFGAGRVERMDRETMHKAREWVGQHFTFVLPEVPTIEEIKRLGDILVYREGIKALVVDPWNELDHSRPPHMNADEYHSKALSDLRNWGRSRKCAVVLSAHPTKLQKDKDGSYPVPTMYDISGSSHFNNKADMGLAVWRNPLTDNPEVHVQKVRFQETGRLGVADFWFDRATGRFVPSS